MGGQPLAAGEPAGVTPSPNRALGRVERNLVALRVLRDLRGQDRPATAQEREALAGWRSWGAEPGIFERDTPRARELRELLTDAEWQAARRTTINAHFTDPALIGAIWQGVRSLGFDGGRVLEPGCGSGLFIGARPGDLDMDITGVELDPVSAEIAQRLHPEAHIRAESFAATPLPEASFDLAIGNVPFADVSLHDPRHNAGHHSLHNHFIIKSLHLTRPGGMVAVLTSRYTMDSVSAKARAEIYEMADLVGAVRLPSGAHQSFAGTDAVTDLVVFRRRPQGEPRRDDAWLTSRVEGDLSVAINDWWRTHPETVIGEMSVEPHGMYGREDLRVHVSDRAATPALFAERINGITQDARAEGLIFEGERAAPTPTVQPVAHISDAELFRGHIIEREPGQWQRLTEAGYETFDVPASASEELRALVGMRDAVMRVLELEGASREDTPELGVARDALRDQYTAYGEKYGPVNRVTITVTSRLDKEGQPIITRRYPTATRIFRTDPHSPVVRALEAYDEQTQTATRATIQERRVLEPPAQVTQAQSPADALAIALDTRGVPDLELIAELLDVEADEARRQLGDLVFDEPGNDRLVPAPEYLSGNVRAKLEAARVAAETDPSYQVNVQALERVIPRDLVPEEIQANLGAVWIPSSDVTRFMRETLSDSAVTVEHLGGANWKVRSGQRHTPAATTTWGTDRMPAHEIIERLMTQRRVVVNDTLVGADGKETSVVNVVATEAAAAKAEALKEHFAQWVWRDPERSERLARVYNDTFNALVLRSYDGEGDRLSLPGLVAGFTPHPHQRAAVARMIGEPAVGLFHAVGAGKTAEMVMGTQELRRLGLVNKPAVIVPNHMLEQFSREWLQLYPAANILAAASEDLRGDGRRDFIAQAATGDWDAIILTQSAFGSIPVSRQAQRDYFDSEIDVVRDQLQRARDAGISNQSLKSMEKAIIRREQRLERLMDRQRDPGMTWEQTGIDYLVVDELHLFKGLPIASNIQDVAVDGSQRATDLHMKLHALRKKAGPRGRVMTGATATPIANSMGEAWVMQRYLRPDLLIDAGLTDFDAWAATFGRTVSKLEMRPAGDGFRVKDRFAAFDNLPELLAMWHVPADVKTAKDLNLPTPPIAVGSDGTRSPEIVAVPMSAAQQDFMTRLAKRSELVQKRMVAPSEDNMLRISSHGRMAGLDVRLLPDTEVGPEALIPALFDQPTKIQVAAGRIAGIWREHREDRFAGSERPGALQIVFCDLGTPSAEKWNVYDGLRDELAERGMDPARVRFVHEANNDEKKGRLFAACRAGEVDVLIGSTSKMGVGTNIQTRAVALHHLDCPWRPADVEQREGRIVRQGNQNPEVQIIRYVTEGSFDGYMWQTVARKAAFIDQVMHGQLDQRSAEDLDNGDGEQFDYATITAVASGNPLLLERAEAQAEFDKLHRLSVGHERAQAHMRSTVHDLDRRIRITEDVIPRLQAAVSAIRPTRGDQFRSVVGGVPHTERPRAADALRARITSAMEGMAWHQREAAIPDLVRLGGHVFDCTLERGIKSTPRFMLQVRGVEDVARIGGDAELLDGNGMVTRLENLIASLPALVESKEHMLVQLRTDREEAQRNLGAPFARADELAAADRRLKEIEGVLQNDGGPGMPHQCPAAPSLPAAVRAAFPDPPSVARVVQAPATARRLPSVEHPRKVSAPER